MVENLLFLGAFFSVLWFVFILMYWLYLPSHYRMTQLEAAKKSLTKDNNKKFSKAYFVISNAHLLYKVKASIVALFFIFLFVIFKGLA